MLRGGMVYPLSTYHLKQELRNHERAMLYLWDPKCSSSVYVSLYQFNEYCKKNDYQPIIITRYLADELFTEIFLKNIGIYAVDIEEFNTSYCPKYLRKFLKKITGSDQSANELYSYTTYLEFRKDTFIKGYLYLAGENQ